MQCGFSGLQVLKTTGSGFANFWRDEQTTLPDTDDRILATTISANWICIDANAEFLDLTSNLSEYRQQIRKAMLKVFASQYSKSVQHTLYEMGRAALEVCPLLGAIDITMPNQHHLLANLTPFGLQNPNEVFVPTSEPFGNISASIARDRSESKS
jgi:urate oxidase